MAITLEHIKERLSYSYVTAVVAKAGAAISKPEPDYGIDATIYLVKQLGNGKYQPTGFGLHCQFKATTACNLENEHIVYDMDAVAYNKLANWEGSSPCILILLRLPQEECNWLEINEEQLLMKNCCYWAHIKEPPTTNKDGRRIRIPRNQIFTPDAVSELLQKVRNSEL